MNGGERLGGALAVTCVTLGLVTWPLAFNLGAYGQVFYQDVFRVVVASSILFAIVWVTRPYRAPWIWLVRLALISPLAWLLAAGLIVGSTSEALDRPAFLIWLVLILCVSVPISLRLLADLFAPEVSSVEDRRVSAAIVALVVVVAALGFAAGRNNHRFMTCADFTLAGSSEPENCSRAD